MEDSALVKAIIQEIGEAPIELFMFIPGAILFVPFYLLAWACAMTVRISPVASVKLCEVAQAEEEPLLRATVCTRNGRPFAFDLWLLKHQLRALARRRAEDLAMSALQRECHGSSVLR